MGTNGKTKKRLIKGSVRALSKRVRELEDQLRAEKAWNMILSMDRNRRDEETWRALGGQPEAIVLQAERFGRHTSSEQGFLRQVERYALRAIRVRFSDGRFRRVPEKQLNITIDTDREPLVFKASQASAIIARQLDDAAARLGVALFRQIWERG